MTTGSNIFHGTKVALVTACRKRYGHGGDASE